MLTWPKRHFARSIASVYPFGANVMSWKLKNGSEVLYARPDDGPDQFNGVRPLKCVYRERMQPAQLGVLTRGLPEAECRSTFRRLGLATGRRVPSRVSSRCKCTASRETWSGRSSKRCVTCVAFELNTYAEKLRIRGTQGLTDFEKWPYVRLRLRDTPYSRSMWDHAFELEYEVTLGERHIIMRLAVRNTGESDFSFTTAMNTCIAVHDIRFPQRSFYKVCMRARDTMAL